MSRINTNVSSLIAQRVLRKNNNSLNTSLARLSTGLKINSGADNPAGLIASENLRAEKAGISITMELLNSKVNHRDYMCDKSAWGVELCKQVGSENFGSM